MVLYFGEDKFNQYLLYDFRHSSPVPFFGAMMNVSSVIIVSAESIELRIWNLHIYA